MTTSGVTWEELYDQREQLRLQLDARDTIEAVLHAELREAKRAQTQAVEAAAYGAAFALWIERAADHTRRSYVEAAGDNADRLRAHIEASAVAAAAVLARENHQGGVPPAPEPASGRARNSRPDSASGD